MAAGTAWSTRIRYTAAAKSLLTGGYGESEAGGWAYYYAQQVWSFYNLVGMCDFLGTPLNALALERFVDYVNAVTGRNMSLYELMKVGERSNTLARLFNCREGFTPAADVLPQRMHEGIGNGALKGERVDPEQFLTARRLYYEMAGWDGDTGRPTAARLAELEVDTSVFQTA